LGIAQQYDTVRNLDDSCVTNHIAATDDTTVDDGELSVRGKQNAADGRVERERIARRPAQRRGRVLGRRQLGAPWRHLGRDATFGNRRLLPTRWRLRVNRRRREHAFSNLVNRRRLEPRDGGFLPDRRWRRRRRLLLGQQCPGGGGGRSFARK